jgi:hypothetical protein
MSSLFDLLEKIQTKPGMYIGSASVTSLRLFLTGYRFSRAELNVPSTEEEINFYRNFQPWLQTKLNVHTANSWDKIILIQSINEQEAWNSFFKLLAEFRHHTSQDVDAPTVERSQQVA